ncbi:MAG: restriction endonuclease [Thermacetogeniaceae bacterium]
MENEMAKIPTYDRLMDPLFKAIRALGGSGTIDEINKKVVEISSIPDQILEIPHGKAALSEVEYRLAWARTYLKKYGVLENSLRGVWSITSSGKDLNEINSKEVVAFVRDLITKEKAANIAVEDIEIGAEDEGIDQPEETQNWREELQSILYKLSSDAFERLTQRILRESGFVQVEVTGKAGDGGIDGKGIARINGLLSFYVMFQCKRYQGSVTPSQIRDFRGAMLGRTDKGLFITTGSFTGEAIKEAKRDGAPPIDLVNGEQLIDILKSLSLGIKTKTIEAVEIDHEWFSAI